jgi:IclR family acetate operon transcriptional repressor
MTTIEKATDVLFFLHAQPGACGVTTVARKLGVPKTSAHRLLRSLLHRNLVERDDSGQYRLGFGLAQLGLGASGHDPLVRLARPALESAARELGETFFLVCMRAGELTVVDKVEGRGFIRAATEVGSTVPVHATAVGKSFAAYLPELAALDQSRLEAYTKQTVTQVHEWRRQVAETRAAGYAVSHDEWIEGLSAVASPILSHGRLVATIAAALVSSRVQQIGESRVAQITVDAARSVSARLQGRES